MHSVEILLKLDCVFYKIANLPPEIKRIIDTGLTHFEAKNPQKVKASGFSDHISVNPDL